MTSGTSSDTSGTTKTEHDRFCPYTPDSVGPDIPYEDRNYRMRRKGTPCQCDFITRVREDEADRAFRTGYQRGYLDALNICPPLHPCVESPVWAGQPNSPKQSETRS